MRINRYLFFVACAFFCKTAFGIEAFSSQLEHAAPVQIEQTLQLSENNLLRGLLQASANDSYSNTDKALERSNILALISADEIQKLQYQLNINIILSNQINLFAEISASQIKKMFFQSSTHPDVCDHIQS